MRRRQVISVGKVLAVFLAMGMMNGSTVWAESRPETEESVSAGNIAETEESLSAEHGTDNGASAENEAYSYVVYGDHVEIVFYKGNGTELMIPEEMDGLPVTSIGDSAFAGQEELVRVILPDSLKTAGEQVFSGCEKLKEVNIGSGLSVIAGGMFENCSALETVIIGPGVTEIKEKAFAGCEALEEIHVPYNVESVCNNSFEGAGLKKVSGTQESIAPVMAEVLKIEYIEKTDEEAEAEMQESAEAETVSEIGEPVEAESEAEIPVAEEAESGAEIPDAEEAESEAEIPDAEEAESEAEIPVAEEAESGAEVSDVEEATADAEGIEEAEKREYILPEAGSQYLTEADVAGLPSQLLAYAGYEIYARHGMLFQSPELAEYFGAQNWYFGFINEAEFPESMLNEYEAANLALLKQQEAASGGAYVPDQENYGYAMIYDYLAGEDVAESAGSAEGENEENTKQANLEEPSAFEQTNTEAQPVSDQTSAEEQTETGTGALETEAAMSETEALEAPQQEGLNLQGNSDDHNVELMPADQTMETQAPANQTPETQTPAVSPSSGSVSVASEYIFPEVDRRYLSRSEVEALSLQAICYAKNEIYARHGRQFLSKELQEYFNSKSWYRGTIAPEQFTDAVFNTFESQNLQLIVACELAIRSDGYQLDQPGYNIYNVNTASALQTAEASAATAISDAEYLNRDYIFQDSDVRYLTEEEVNVISSRVACYARNEIYARRGCQFASPELQNFFGQKQWYFGRINVADFSVDLLNKFELYNIELLSARELALEPSGYQLN